MVQIGFPPEAAMDGRSRGRSRGVTLLEMLVAIGVLAAALSALFQIFPMGFSSSARASATATAYELASQKMQEIRSRCIFGGDPDPTKSNADSSTYKYFGYRGGDPLSDILGNSAKGTDTFTTDRYQANEQFCEFATADGYNVESKYFYRVSMVPITDVTQRSGNYIYATNASASTDPSISSGSSRYGFCDAYRVTVTVRGPLPSADCAQGEINDVEGQWKHYYKGAAEATLSTIIANRNVGVAGLAYDLICRYDNGSGEVKWSENRMSYIGSTNPTGSAKLDSRSIYVTGPKSGGSAGRFYPENFTVIRPEMLSANERYDTGPAIVMPFSSFSNVSREADGVYAYRMGGTADDCIAAGKPVPEVNYNDYKGEGSGVAPNGSWGDPMPSGATGSSLAPPFAASGYSVSNYTNLAQARPSGSYCAPGGLNYLNQDNIMLVCQCVSSVDSNKRYLVAESNKLIFMAPPNSDSEVVNQYGGTYKTTNKTPYWRFDLLNQVYGRDSDCSSRHRKYSATGMTENIYYGADPLCDVSWGDPEYKSGASGATSDGYLHRGDLDLGRYQNPSTGYGSYDAQIGLSGESAPRSVTLTSTDAVSGKHYYGYPRAKWNADGTLESGTMVRFLMKMYDPRYSTDSCP